jgi:hypothetical protein
LPNIRLNFAANFVASKKKNQMQKFLEKNIFAVNVTNLFYSSITGGLIRLECLPMASLKGLSKAGAHPSGAPLELYAIYV